MMHSREQTIKGMCMQRKLCHFCKYNSEKKDSYRRLTLQDPSNIPCVNVLLHICKLTLRIK